MKGVQFIQDDKGRKTAVVIDLKKHGDVWEDLYDSLLAAQRADEPRESLAAVKQRLRQAGKLRADQKVHCYSRASRPEGIGVR